VCEKQLYLLLSSDTRSDCQAIRQFALTGVRIGEHLIDRRESRRKQNRSTGERESSKKKDTEKIEEISIL